MPRPIWDYPTYRETRDEEGRLLAQAIDGDDLAEWSSQFDSEEEAKPYGMEAAKEARS